MNSFELQSQVNVSLRSVFAVYSDFEHVAEYLSRVEAVTLLTPGPVGKGSRLRQQRRVLGKLMNQELECVEYTHMQGFVMRAELSGSEFLSEFRFAETSSGDSRVELRLISRPVGRLGRLAQPLACSLTAALQPLFWQDMLDLKKAAESRESL